MEVVDGAGVPGPQQAPHHVGPHPPQADHAQLHTPILSSRDLPTLATVPPSPLRRPPPAPAAAEYAPPALRPSPVAWRPPDGSARSGSGQDPGHRCGGVATRVASPYLGGIMRSCRGVPRGAPARSDGRSSIGRVAVSKTVGCRFESCRPCHGHQVTERPAGPPAGGPSGVLTPILTPIRGGHRRPAAPPAPETRKAGRMRGAWCAVCPPAGPRLGGADAEAGAGGRPGGASCPGPPGPRFTDGAGGRGCP